MQSTQVRPSGNTVLTKRHAQKAAAMPVSPNSFLHTAMLTLTKTVQPIHTNLMTSCCRHTSNNTYDTHCRRQTEKQLLPLQKLTEKII